MVTPHRGVVQLEDEIVRRVLHHADLFEDDIALEGEISRPNRRLEDEIPDYIRGDLEMLVEHSRLIDGVFAGRVGVEGAAQTLERERDLPGAAAARPLEDH